MNELDKGLGIWQILNSNLITDIIASAGFNITILDLEHGLHSPEKLFKTVYSLLKHLLCILLREFHLLNIRMLSKS